MQSMLEKWVYYCVQNLLAFMLKLLPMHKQNANKLKFALNIGYSTVSK